MSDFESAVSGKADVRRFQIMGSRPSRAGNMALVSQIFYSRKYLLAANIRRDFSGRDRTSRRI
jgi:hypothetical protein